MLKAVGFPSVRSGNQTINSGNLIIGTAGNGIDFSASPNPGGMTSELLNDYEEGGWTPAVTFGGSSAGFTYTRQAGRYTKVGKLVTVTWDIRLATGGSNTGAFGVSNLPFTSEGVGNGFNVANIYFYSGFVGLQKVGIAYNNGSTTLNELVDAAGVAVSNTQVSGSAVFFGTMSYLAA